MKTTKQLLAVAALTLNFQLQTLNCFAQNLVPNPDFETFSSCPAILNIYTGTAPNPISVPLSNWVIPTFGTADCFNTCNTGTAGVPGNQFGSEPAASGSCYTGFRTYDDFDATYREYIQANITALAPGTTYTVSFYASCAEGPGGAGLSSKLGAYLSSGLPPAPSPSGFEYIPVTPQIVSPATIDATTGWTLVTGTFASGAGGQNYITIGNFENGASIILGNGPIGFSKSIAYYYIDNVCVTPVGGTGCGIVTPIQLLSFTANCTPPLSVGEGPGVRINWSTATETNNDYFTIDRSTSPDPSKGGGLNWEAAGTVKGAGNSSTVRSYKFIDNQVLPFGEGQGGVVYYRLRQTDYDGKTETFNNQQVAVDVTECAVQVFPNPAGNTLNIPYTAEQDGEITLQVYDVIGKLVKDKTVSAIKSHNNFIIDLSTVAQGMYVLRVKNGVKENNQKFVKQ